MQFSLTRSARGRNGKRSSDPFVLPAEAACWTSRGEPPLGQLFADARERRGLAPEQAARDAHIMVSYLKMIERGNYSAIPDMLYLLPFIQRYAAFLGLDVKEITARFVRDFEAEENAAAVPQVPAAAGMRFIMRSLPWRRIAQSAAMAVGMIVLAGFAFVVTRAAAQRPAEVSPNALTSLPPPVRVRIASTPAAAAATPAIQLSEAAPTAAQAAAPKTTANQHRHQTRGISTQHRRRRHHHG